MKFRFIEENTGMGGSVCDTVSRKLLIRIFGGDRKASVLDSSICTELAFCTSTCAKNFVSVAGFSIKIIKLQVALATDTLSVPHPLCAG